jgi:hypothetical protein
MYSKEFARYLESYLPSRDRNEFISFKKRQDIINLFLSVNKDTKGRFSSVSINYTVIKDGLIYDFGNIGINMTEQDVIEIYDAYKEINRENKLNKLLS